MEFSIQFNDANWLSLCMVQHNTPHIHNIVCIWIIINNWPEINRWNTVWFANCGARSMCVAVALFIWQIFIFINGWKKEKNMKIKSEAKIKVILISGLLRSIFDMLMVLPVFRHWRHHPREVINFRRLPLLVDTSLPRSISDERHELESSKFEPRRWRWKHAQFRNMFAVPCRWFDFRCQLKSQSFFVFFGFGLFLFFPDFLSSNLISAFTKMVCLLRRCLLLFFVPMKFASLRLHW